MNPNITMNKVRTFPCRHRQTHGVQSASLKQQLNFWPKMYRFSIAYGHLSSKQTTCQTRKGEVWSVFFLVQSLSNVESVW